MDTGNIKNVLKVAKGLAVVVEPNILNGVNSASGS